MKSLTIEFQRFGDAPGILRLSDRYLRTIGTAGPGEEVGFGVSQDRLANAMKCLDYQNFRGAKDPQEVRVRANTVLQQLAPHLEKFLGPRPSLGSGDRPYQLDVLTHAYELAQLPFEVLEAADRSLVVTRRIRQPWPRPPIVREDKPRVLFAWAEPKVSKHSKPMKVPHEHHHDLLRQVLSDWGDKALVPLPNATRKTLAAKLAHKDHGFTHVHLLAHGVGPGRADSATPFDLLAEPPPPTFLALDDGDGGMDRCRPAVLKDLFQPGVPRPASFAIATCHSGEIKEPFRYGGTLAHVVHEAGVPIVLASQLALTKTGSDQLIETFLAQVVNGGDPRLALRACRDKLRKSREVTYYDRVALVCYVHLEEDFDRRLPETKLKVALARLEAASKDAEARAGQLLEHGAAGSEESADPEDIAQRFASVRNRLEKLKKIPSLTKAQREELHGLQASSLKREAEEAWRLSQGFSGDDQSKWQDRSLNALSEAMPAYARAAQISRDHHWTWVQWLALTVVTEGTLEGREEDWIVARAAATDAANLTAADDAPASQRRATEEDAIWARGSLAELCLLSPMAGRGDALAQAKVRLDELVARCEQLSFPFPIKSTLKQLGRYANWWGADPRLRPPPLLLEQADELHAHLTALTSAP